MKRQIFGIILVVMLAFSLPALASAQQIGYVDFEFLFYSHPEYEVKNKELQESAERLYQEVQAEAEKLATQEEIDELAAYYELQFEQIEHNVRVDLVTFILDIIGEVAAANNIDVVLPESGVIYGGINLTVPVIEAMYGSYGISVPSSIRELLE